MDDPGFELTRHVKRVRLPGPGNVHALQRFMSEERAKALPRTRPLWVMFLVEGVHLEDGTIGSAVVIRTHHAIADGVRLTQVMLSMCDSDQASVEAVVSRRGAVESASWLPIPLPAPVRTGIETALESVADSAADSIRTVGGGLVNVVNAAGSATVGAAGTVAAAVAGALLTTAGRVRVGPIGTAAELPSALAAAPGAGLDLVRSGAGAVRDGLQAVAHPGQLANAVRLLGSKDNRVVNDVASVTKLVLSDSPDTVWSGELGVSKTIAWSTPVSLADVKAISRSQNATVNDVLLAAMAGGVRRYLELHGAPVDEIQWLVPVNLKPFADNLPAELGNYFSLVMLPMPLDAPDAANRIRQMKAQMERIKNSDEAVITFTLQRFMSMSPNQIQFQLTNFFANKTVGVLTNVPGPQGLLRFGGSPVVQIIGFAPCSGSNPMAATLQLQRHGDHRFRDRHRTDSRPRGARRLRDAGGGRHAVPGARGPTSAAEGGDRRAEAGDRRPQAADAAAPREAAGQLSRSCRKAPSWVETLVACSAANPPAIPPTNGTVTLTSPSTVYCTPPGTSRRVMEPLRWTGAPSTLISNVPSWPSAAGVQTSTWS